LDFSYAGTGGGLANIDISTILQITSLGYTANLVEFTQNNASSTADFYLEFTPELAGDIALGFFLNSRVIDDGLDDDMVKLQFVNKISSQTLQSMSSPSEKSIVKNIASSSIVRYSLVIIKSVAVTSSVALTSLPACS
jgi:hypothetical protein